jgi:two-component system chemotaxis sensor kinase CheA
VERSSLDFKADIQALLDEFFADLDDLREQRNDFRIINSLFRRVHTIKGSAATIGLEETTAIAHHLEGLLAAIRDGRVPLSEDAIVAIEDAANLITSSIAADGSTSEPVVTAVLAQLQTMAAAPARDFGTEAENLFRQLPSDIWQSLTEPQKAQITRLYQGGAQLFLLSTDFDIADFDQQFCRLKEELEEIGDVVSTYPSVAADAATSINFRLLFASRAAAGEIENHAGRTFKVKIDPVVRTTPQIAPSIPDQPPIRLAAHELDRLIPSIEELSRVISATLKWAIANSAGSKRSKLKSQSAQIQTSLSALEEQLNELRMVPLGQVLKRAERVGRAAARAENKPILFETSGTEIRIDKAVAANVADGLIHLVRNAVDHGIESQEERVSVGKRPQGRIQLTAFAEEDQVCIRITDDGRGIDPAAVSRAAAAAGAIAKDVTLSYEECLPFIFEPGFTTKDAVTATSGRGIGLDVVQNSVNAVGGEIAVTSEPGIGSVFELRLPREMSASVKLTSE